jgi:hypothetical protein
VVEGHDFLSIFLHITPVDFTAPAFAGCCKAGADPTTGEGVEGNAPGFARGEVNQRGITQRSQAHGTGNQESKVVGLGSGAECLNVL